MIVKEQLSPIQVRERVIADYKKAWASGGGPVMYNMNIAIGCSDDDARLFFDDELVFSVDESWNMAHALVAVGLFDSMGDAKKANRVSPIPTGFNDRLFGNKHTIVRITTLNIQ
jgi:hypothetical protein